MIARTLLLVGLLAVAAPAMAGEHSMPPVDNAVVSKECGTCHMAFQPGFLPARSWLRITEGLANHFGEDASIPADTVGIIRDYLTANAGDVTAQGGTRKFMRWIAPEGVPLRITENPAFLRKHRFPDSVWRDPKVVTKSNCLACHAGANRGLYE